MVAGLRHPRRLAALDGAVGTRFALTNPGYGTGVPARAWRTWRSAATRAPDSGRGPRAGRTRATPGRWRRARAGRCGRPPAYRNTKASTDADSATLSGTVERNAVAPRSRPLYLVQCDLAVSMVAEVAVNGRGPYTAAGQRTIPGNVGLGSPGPNWRRRGCATRRNGRRSRRRRSRRWARPAQFGTPGPAAENNGAKGGGENDGHGRVTGKARAGRQEIRREEEQGREGNQRGDGHRHPGGAPTPLPWHAKRSAHRLRPDRRTARLRTPPEAAALGREGPVPAEDLLPSHRLDDRFDNVQRLLRVLDQAGATGLLAGSHGRRRARGTAAQQQSARPPCQAVPGRVPHPADRCR
ncbi:hypothetical protein LV779_06995 [Streptomyces thinghirensis]|nr:hypothetical protein [Streptomyces thinghirensis]